MSEIVYRNLSENGPVTEVRELANHLFKLQSERADKYRDILGAMTFESRGIERSFNNASPRYLVVAYDGDKPVGYVYCDGSVVVDFLKTFRPPWPHFEEQIPQNVGGLFPAELECPVMCSHLNNLFVEEEYRGKGIGKKLMEGAMEWLRSVEGSKYIFVHVSNGNNVVPFYEKYGFRYTHDVFDGLIWCYAQEI